GKVRPHHPVHHARRRVGGAPLRPRVRHDRAPGARPRGDPDPAPPAATADGRRGGAGEGALPGAPPRRDGGGVPVKAAPLGEAAVTLLEIFLGFALAFVVGIGLALLIFISRTVERAVYPLVIASQTVPVFAIAPLLVVWLGYGMISKVAMTALIVFFPIVV